MAPKSGDATDYLDWLNRLKQICEDPSSPVLQPLAKGLESVIDTIARLAQAAEQHPEAQKLLGLSMKGLGIYTLIEHLCTVGDEVHNQISKLPKGSLNERPLRIVLEAYAGIVYLLDSAYEGLRAGQFHAFPSLRNDIIDRVDRATTALAQK